jgi:hypothetical protein
MNSHVVLLLGAQALDNFEKSFKLRPILEVQLPGPSPDRPVHVLVDAIPSKFEVRRVLGSRIYDKEYCGFGSDTLFLSASDAHEIRTEPRQNETYVLRGTVVKLLRTNSTI